MMRPRPYLSWSQLDLWEKSPERYKQSYIYDNKPPINSGQAFGKQMADGLEIGEATGDPVLDMVSGQLPRFEVMEAEVTAEIKDRKSPFKILSRLDTAKSDLTAFKEYKTGQKPWTRKQVDDSGQITFYATAIYLKTGKIPQDIELVNIFTKASLDGKIEATGEIRRHPTTRNMAQVLQMMVRMKKAWAGIGRMCEEELI